MGEVGPPRNARGGQRGIVYESGFYNLDCMDALKEYPDNYFDLCIADPPYGDGGGR